MAYRFDSVNAVDSPAHYQSNMSGLQAIDVIEQFDLNFCLGNAVKYILRAGKKCEDTYDEDLRKAIWYLQHELSKASNFCPEQ